MSDGYPIQTNFTSGEVSPLITGRTDINKYFNGARKLQNFIVKPQGGTMRRSGTRFVSEVKDSTAVTIVRKFIFSTSQAYVLEFGNNYIRFYRNGGQIKLAGVPVEVPTPYITADLRALSFTESADILYIVHPNYPPAQLERFSDTSWGLLNVVTTDGPYLSQTMNSVLSCNLIVNDYLIATATAAIFTLPATIKNITQISNVSGNVNILCTAHGFSTGDSISVYIPSIGILTGQWRVNVINANNFTLKSFYNPSYFLPWVSFGLGAGPYSLSGTASPTTATAGSEKYIEYKNQNQWGLARIINPISTTQAIVVPVDNILVTDPTIIITAGTGGDTVSSTSAFNILSVGNYIRLTGTAGWHFIITYGNPSGVSGAVVSLVTYSYPSVQVNLDLTTRFILYRMISDITNTFVSTDLGRLIRLNYLGTQIPGTIIFYENSTTVLVTTSHEIPIDQNNSIANFYPNVPSLLNSSNAVSWKIGAWSVSTGYPSCVCFHQQRLVFASSITELQTVWMSKSGDYYNFAPTGASVVVVDSTVSDDNAITATLVSQSINQILWMNSGPVLLLGTTFGEWAIKASSITNALTPSNFDATQQTDYGSQFNFSTRIGTSLLYPQRGGTKVREMVYNFQFDQYESKDVTIVSEHIIRNTGKAIDASWALEPNALLWIVTDGGGLCCLTYQKDQEVFAWTPHVIGGNGFVEGIASIPSINGVYDTTYLVVKRTINGVTRRYIEYFENEFWPTSTTDKLNMLFTDSSSTYNGSPVNSVSGLGYLEAQFVQVLADGSFRTPVIVSGGAVTFDGNPASVVSVGLQYASLFQMMPIDSGSPQGTSQGKVKRLDKLVVRLLNSLGMKIGEDLNKLENISFRGNSDPMDSSPPLFTGDKERKISGTYDRDVKLFIQQDQPYPLNIIAIMPHLVTNSS